jgi:4-alpha-glucanotransferase
LENSPYSPSTRLFLNPLYLRIEDVPGARESVGELRSLGRRAQALNQERLIDRNQVWQLKTDALQRLWRRFPGSARLERFRAEIGPLLRSFAIFNALVERHGREWQKWPSGLRHPDGSQIQQFAQENEERVRFHEWVQWLLDEQLARAARELALMLDLPVGVNAGGFDAWLWQDVLALDAAMGAPPDLYNTQGQNWGLPPFIPHRLRAVGYEPWRLTLRAMLRHARGLRIDHVMGLFRLYWIPQTCAAVEGAFVRYPAEELLAVLAIEAQRAGAMVVGEDLGTVEPGIRRRLRRHQVLSYRLMWFETTPPERYPPQALAAITTHDLFTIAGLWTGSDLASQERLQLNPNAQGTRLIQRRVGRLAGVTAESQVSEAIPKLHEALARAPSKLRTATLEDALGVEERPNLPGTVDQWPNWRIALPVPLEDLRKHPSVHRVARAMQSRGKAGTRKRSRPT